MKEKTDLLCPECNKEYLIKEKWTEDLGYRYTCSNCGFSEYRRKHFK